jgi:opacity protein-like surface antigen
VLRLFAIMLVLANCALPMVAQSERGDYSNLEFFAGYSANGYFVNESSVTAVNQKISLFFSDRAGGDKGFEVSMSRNLKRYFGLKGDFSTYFETLHGQSGTICQGVACTTGQSFKVPLRSSYFLAGPEFKFRNASRLTPFAHALAGVVRSNAKFATTGPGVSFSDSNAQTGFAAAFGGGLDLRVSRRIGFRTMLDYTPTFLSEADPAESGPQHHVRITVGIVLHFH